MAALAAGHPPTRPTPDSGISDREQTALACIGVCSVIVGVLLAAPIAGAVVGLTVVVVGVLLLRDRENEPEGPTPIDEMPLRDLEAVALYRLTHEGVRF